MALACDLRPLTPDEWLAADIGWRNDLIDARRVFDEVYGPELEKHRERKRLQAEADARARRQVGR